LLALPARLALKQAINDRLWQVLDQGVVLAGLKQLHQALSDLEGGFNRRGANVCLTTFTAWGSATRRRHKM
jgi:hypothetical protein